VLDGGALTPSVMERLERSDALVALMTRRDPLPDGTWRTHPWVRDEINHIRGRGQPAVALVEDGVAVEGAYAEHERLSFRRESPLDAFLGLSHRLANWKRELGRTLCAKVLPSEIGHDIAGDASWKCVYRFWTNGRPDDWIEGMLVPAEGGTEIYIQRVRDDSALVEVQVLRNGQATWRSPATPQRLLIQLKSGAGA
jgi:hypothetical protein